MARAALTQDEIADFRESICESATRLFAEHGYAGVTLRAIAAELGCSPMTPYRYFADKEAIFASVRAAAFDRFAAVLRTAAGCSDAEARLVALGDAYVQFALEEPHAYRIMFELDQTPASHDQELRCAEANAWNELRDSVVYAVRAGVVAGDPNLLAHCYWAALHGVVSLHLAGKLQLGRSLEELVSPMLRAVLDGTRPHATRATRTDRPPRKGEKE